MLRELLITTGLVLSAEAHAEDRALLCAMAGPEAATFYINALTNALETGDQNIKFDGLHAIVQKYSNCRKGENISVPEALPGLWQQQCDFGKAIVHSRPFVICIKR